MNLRIIFLFIFCGLASGANAQLHLEHRIQAGFNIGGTAPVGLPNTIRKINSYRPEFCPSLGYELSWRPANSAIWGAAVGVKLDYKGMTTTDEVMYFHTMITMEDGSGKSEFEGAFTGKNRTTVRNAYVSFPISATYTPNANWRLHLGGYMAWLFSANFYGNVSDGYIRNGSSLGEKVNVEEAEFDFGTDMRRFDVGLQGGAERSIGKKINVMGTLNWGLRPVFPSEFRGMDFPMYNIYFTLGVSYRIQAQ